MSCVGDVPIMAIRRPANEWPCSGHALQNAHQAASTLKVPERSPCFVESVSNAEEIRLGTVPLPLKQTGFM